ncbi:cyclic nucleotide-binding domain-containing protein [Desulfobacterales bacterium HSG17]|nr:cyclic nucleotide-binding domain-containing protein [Desulfobacterales bacterium HSG17]
MNIPETTCKIIEDHQCPLYKLGDVFTLSGRSLLVPPGKSVCMTLMTDFSVSIAKYNRLDNENKDKSSIYRFICSGPETSCTGAMRMEARVRMEDPDSIKTLEKYEKIRSIINVLSQFPIFRGLNEGQLKELGTFLKLINYKKGDIVIERGTPGLNLYIIASGRVEVIGEDDITIAVLDQGEIFGEMSLISGQAVGATIKVVEPLKLLYIKGKDFGKILESYPSVQIYFARLLATRLAKTNIARTEDFKSGMTGNLFEIPPAELFQSLNVNQKSGTVELSFSNKTAIICFKDGELVRAEYDSKLGTEAFFNIIKQTNGRFKFSSELSEKDKKSPALGEFMWLLMEGVRKIDEAKEC